MQGLADGYFVLPYTISDYLARVGANKPDPESAPFKETLESVVAMRDRFLNNKGKQSTRSFHIRLGKVMWDKCGMARNKEGLEQALREILEIRREFWEDVRVPGDGESINVELERAGRIADFLEFGELMCHDALRREESCGGHFREEHQTDDGEALRDDDNFSHVSIWEHQGDDQKPKEEREPLDYEFVARSTRSYK